MVELLESVRRSAARAVNAVMTATYWDMGRRIVEVEQGGKGRAQYGQELLERLSEDLTARFGRGFSLRNLRSFRSFYLAWPIRQTLSAESGSKGRGLAAPNLSDPASIARRFPLPWSHYVRLLSVGDMDARAFYEAEALRAGWSARQLDRQIATLFYERTLLSRNKAAVLRKADKPRPDEIVTPEEEIKDPLVLEFLGLKDEYSESELEEALIGKLEHFLLELGGDFTFVARQRRLRIGDEWYRVDLLFFHRRLRCLVVIDLKVDKFTHADAGQMHLYLNYARENWVLPGENPPVGLILCTRQDAAVARYALEGLPNKVLAAQYNLALPDPKTLAHEMARTRKLLETRRKGALE
ncbi:MAG: PDDEXK nuclease domain-containing protein [Planctomycetota bacterium]|nr:PDDEXK nuclease domain-containing protein [Planctomycetota bacterium]